MAILDSIIGGLFGVANNTANIVAQRKMLERQYEMQNEMWEKEQNYNLPKNQVQRMIDANLNPNLMYGQGTPGNSMGFSTAPNPSNPSNPNPFANFNGLDNLLMTDPQYRANVENIKADTAEKRAMAENLDENSSLQREQKLSLQYANYVAGKTLENDVETKRLFNRQVANMVNLSSYDSHVADLKYQFGLSMFEGIMHRDGETEEEKIAVNEHNQNASLLTKRLGASVCVEIMTGEYMLSQLQNAKDIANISADAQRFSAIVSASASRYASDKHLEGIIKNLKETEGLRDAQIVSLFSSAYKCMIEGDFQKFVTDCERIGVNPNNSSTAGTIINFIRGVDGLGYKDFRDYKPDQDKQYKIDEFLKRFEK